MTAAPTVNEPLEKLDKPPIDEVVCGVFFEPIPELDPLVIGTYWMQRKEEYPLRELKPAIREGIGFIVDALPSLRVWLIHKNDQFIIQIQSDRFYVNWRKRSADYPSFSGRDGKPGVLAALLQEYVRFSKFCQDTLGAGPVANRIELAKVDVFIEGAEQGDAWRDLADLAVMLPWLGPFAAFHVSGSPVFALRFDEPRADGLLAVSMGLGTMEGPNATGKRAVKMETRITKPSTSDVGGIETAFRSGNEELNAVFARLIPKNEREKRFKR
jgi:uncharacterized protein (TIGR04255 family)